MAPPTQEGDYRLIYIEQEVTSKTEITRTYEFNEGDRIKKVSSDKKTDIVSLHIYNKVSGSLTSAKDDVDFASCWASESLTFTQTSLGEVCRYLSKWYGVEIVVPEHLKTSCSYTFTIREEPIDQILEIMSRLNPMKYLYTNDHRIIISEIN